MNDDAVKIVLNTKGTIDDVSPEMKRILDYIEGKIELLAHDFHLTVPEIAEKLLLSEDEVQRILDHLQ